MTFKNVRALERGLNVLLAVNQKNAANIQQIADMTGIPRPTVYRILETLRLQGYVEQGTTDNRWQTTLLSKALSSGFRDEDWVAKNAVPHMIELGEKVLWPLDLVTFQNFEMIVRESTHSFSPFSIDHGVVGQSLPLLETSGGRCYLAFCSDNERAVILEGLKKSGRLKSGYLQSAPNIDFMLGQIRELGLGFRREGFREHTMSLSAPIMSGKRIIACLSLIVIASAMSFEKALENYSADLLETASKISRELSALQGGINESGRSPA